MLSLLLVFFSFLLLLFPSHSFPVPTGVTHRLQSLQGCPCSSARPPEAQCLPKVPSSMESLPPIGIPSPVPFHMPPPVSSGGEEISHYVVQGLGYSPKSGCGPEQGIHAMDVRGATAGFHTGMPVGKSHRETPDRRAHPPSPTHLFFSSCVHPGLSAHGGIQRECLIHFLPQKNSKLPSFQCWSCLMGRVLDRKSPRAEVCSQLCRWLAGSSTSTLKCFFFVGTPDRACYSVFSLEAVQNRVCLSLRV